MKKTLTAVAVASSLPFIVMVGLLLWGVFTNNNTWYISVMRDGAVHKHYLHVSTGSVHYAYWSPTSGDALIRFHVESWKLFAVIISPPVFWIWKVIANMWRTGCRRKKGACLECGYDLRATPKQCPECGTIPRPSKGD